MRFGRVSNRLIMSGLIAGFYFKLAEYGWYGIYYFLRNISVPVILLYLLFLMRVLGAGDIKLFSMIGGILTVGELYRCMVYGFAAGGIFAIFYLVKEKDGRERLLYVVKFLVRCISQKQLVSYEAFNGKKLTMAFSIPIFAGTIAALYLPFH